MVTITYDALNDLVHNVAYEIEKATGLNKDTTLDLYALNDTMTSYLDHYGVQYVDEEDPEFDPKRQAILNVQTAEKRVMRVWEHSQNDELNEAIAELQQAVRFLTGEEVPA